MIDDDRMASRFGIHEEVPEDARTGFTFSKFEKTECPLDFHWKANLVRLGSSRSIMIYLDVLYR